MSDTETNQITQTAPEEATDRSPLAGLSSDDLRAALAERGELPPPQPYQISVPAGGILFVSAQTGLALAHIGETPVGGGITVFDAQGAVVAVVQASAYGVGHLGAVVDGKTVAHLTGDASGGNCTVFDAEGRAGAALNPTQSGGEVIAYDHLTGKQSKLAAPSLLTEAFPAGLHSPHKLN